NGNNGNNGGDDTAADPDAVGTVGGVMYKRASTLSGEINFWSWDEMFNDVIVEFNKVYPNIKVNFTQLEIGALHDRLQTTITAGAEAPDVSHILGGDHNRVAQPGLLEDL